jgi:flagellar biosynthesis chaperone FliJ
MLKSAKSEKNSAEGELKRIETKVANLEKDMEEKMAKARSGSLQSGEQKDQTISNFEETIKEKEGSSCSM